jgi:hypothetical protein
MLKFNIFILVYIREFDSFKLVMNMYGENSISMF